MRDYKARRQLDVAVTAQNIVPQRKESGRVTITQISKCKTIINNRFGTNSVKPIKAGTELGLNNIFPIV